MNPKGESERWAGVSPGPAGTEQREVKLHVCKEDRLERACQEDESKCLVCQRVKSLRWGIVSYEATN